MLDYSRDNGNWTAGPNALVRCPSLSDAAFRVYMVLASFSGPTGVHPAVGTIAALIGGHRTTIQRALRQLREQGLLSTWREGNKQHYRLHQPTIAEHVQARLKP